ncbi:MAG TPA: radical SAM protein [Bryobacteraceae bacterium]|nr:radical SAM protein [Bryobacteraceae bacterium]
MDRRPTRHWIDAACGQLPVLDGVWSRYGGRVKKAWCLALDRVGRLPPSSFVLWIATYRCNFRCPFCEAQGGNAAPGELTTAEARTFIEDLPRLGARRLLISGGEPLMRRDMPELLDHAQRRSVTPGLLSNGFAVRERWEEIKRFRYFLFMTSLDGLKEDHDRLRGVGSFERVLDSLDLFASAGVGTRVVRTIVHPGNLGRLPELAACLEATAATDWQLTPAMETGRARQQEAYRLSATQWGEVIDLVERSRDRRRLNVELSHAHSYLHCLKGRPGHRPSFCGAGLTRCAVMPNGDVLACGQAYDAAAPEGNIRLTPLSEIWRHGFASFRRFEQPATCHGCSFWSACQGGCWAERQIHGRCLRDALVTTSRDGDGSERS